MNKDKEPILPPEEVEHLARDIGRPIKGDFRARVMAQVDEIAKEELKSKAPATKPKARGREMTD